MHVKLATHVAKSDMLYYKIFDVTADPVTR